MRGFSSLINASIGTGAMFSPPAVIISSEIKHKIHSDPLSCTYNRRTPTKTFDLKLICVVQCVLWYSPVRFCIMRTNGSQHLLHSFCSQFKLLYNTQTKAANWKVLNRKLVFMEHREFPIIHAIGVCLPRDLCFVLCSRDFHVLCAQRIIGVFIVITHKSIRLENPITWVEAFSVRLDSQWSDT